MYRKRLLKSCVTNMWRRFKYFFIYLSLLILLYIFFVRRTSLDVPVKKSSVHLQYVTVHFDLKGSPPKLSYMETILPILSIYGVNSILVEYEDMFPYEGSIVNISSENSYRRNELLRLINKARTLNIEIIPLIQTFGHMEYVLKLKEFAHLRELKQFPADICPSNPLGHELIATMLKQVIDLHATIKPLKHIHIGCDEVRKINKCLKCRDRELETTDLFVNHVEEVTSIVKELSPLTNVLIWGDMLFKIKKPQTFTLNDVEAVAWDYAAHPRFSHKYFYNLHRNFKNIWIASAFKGADGRNATIPNIKNRFQNHLSWLQFILDYKFGGENKVYDFKGIILTGWSRYSHMAPQCELLPVAMPSLILNLLLINIVKKGIDEGDIDLPYCDFFNKYLSKEFREIFRSYDDTDEKCAFENTLLFIEQEKLFNTTIVHDCLFNLLEHESQCRSISLYVDVTTLDISFTKCTNALKQLADSKTQLESFMIQYYKNNVIKTYIDEIVHIPTKKIKRIMDYLQNCTKDRFWNRRH